MRFPHLSAGDGWDEQKFIVWPGLRFEVAYEPDVLVIQEYPDEFLWLTVVPD
jgi:hypothetical protein